MPTWKVHLRHCIGACSILVGIVGLLFDLLAIFVQTSGIGVSQPRIHFPYVFLLVCSVAMIWFTCCFLSGIYLWRGERRGYWMALSLALFEIAYVLLFAPITLSFYNYSQRGIEVVGHAILEFKKVDNGLSLLYSLILVFLLGAFFRKRDFTPENTLTRATLSDKFRLRLKPIYVVRGLGVANLVFGFLGILLALVDIFATYIHRDLLGRRGISWEMSTMGSAIDLGLLAGLLFAGYLLVHVDRRGVVISNVVLSAELVYWLGVALTPSLSDFSNLGLVPQVVTGYPLLALPLLNWGAKHLGQSNGWKCVLPPSTS